MVGPEYDPLITGASITRVSSGNGALPIREQARGENQNHAELSPPHKRLLDRGQHFALRSPVCSKYSVEISCVGAEVLGSTVIDSGQHRQVEAQRLNSAAIPDEPSLKHASNLPNLQETEIVT